MGPNKLKVPTFSACLCPVWPSTEASGQRPAAEVLQPQYLPGARVKLCGVKRLRSTRRGLFQPILIRMCGSIVLYKDT